jgi:hypothetical protein
MAECSAMRENMPLLLTESLDPARRELSHQHIETCAECADEWASVKETWLMLGDLPEVAVPPRVKEQFLQRAGIAPVRESNVVAFRQRPAFKWIAQAAAVAVLVGGSYFLGDRNAERIQPSEATLIGVAPAQGIQPVSNVLPASMSLSETRVLDAEALSPEIEGRPNITNVQFVDADASDNQIAVAFDVSSRWTVTGSPKDRSMVRLLSYMLENEESMTPRSSAMEWVRRTYSNPANADPEIANALAKVLRNDSHEGVRIRAVETLTNLPPENTTRNALIEALKSDPNPAVRIKAVEALARLASSGAELDSDMVDTLRQKASQQDENLYVRVKAAEALSNIKPQ